MKLGQISEAKQYSFINARVMARKGQLFTTAYYERLLSSSLTEGLTYIQDTPRYRGLFTNLELDSSDFTKNLEKILNESLYQEIYTLTKDIPEKPRKLIEYYSKKSYFNLLKNIIRRIHTNDMKPLALEDVNVANPEDRAEIVIISDAKSIKGLIQKIQTPWIKEALNSKLVEYQQTKNIILLENALDHSYYQQLWDFIIPPLSSKDKGVSQKIIGMEIDLINISIILRSKFHNFQSNEILKQLIPVNYRLGANLTLATEALSFSDAIDKLKSTVYSDLIRAINNAYRENEESIENMEQLQQEWFIQALFTMLAGYPFHIGVTLSYLIFRMREIENLRIIFETKWKDIDLETARQLLIYFK